MKKILFIVAMMLLFSCEEEAVAPQGCFKCLVEKYNIEAPHNLIEVVSENTYCYTTKEWAESLNKVIFTDSCIYVTRCFEYHPGE